MKITAIRGFNDILPNDTRVWKHIEDRAWEVFTGYGFSEIKVPIVEKTELFARSIGETTDIVEKEMYTFGDRRGDQLTLRPEGTASVVRAFVEHKMYTTPVTKLCYKGPMFRYERPQKGRYRQFYQIGAEVLGDGSPWTDAETIEMLVRLFNVLDLKGVELGVNSLGCPECRPGYKKALLEFLNQRLDELCDNCKRRVGTNPLRALDCKSTHCIEATNSAPSILDHLCAGCGDHFADTKRYLDLLGMDYRVNPRMVRGLDYYTRTTFEITSTGLGAQNAVAAGGRYDLLVEELGGPPTPCFGFAMGMERLALLLGEKGVAKAPLTVFIALGEEAENKAAKIVSTLRERGVRVVADLSGGGLKKRMKRADRMGADYAVILGEDELSKGMASVKEMAGATQETVPWEDLAAKLSSVKPGTGAG